MTPEQPPSGSAHDRVTAARRAAAGHAGWYHQIELVPGVTTPGMVDLRPLVDRALPTDLSGRRCLDVGTFDGFYAFAMEDRGATDVVAIDVASSAELEHPPPLREANLADADASGIVPGDGFRVAAAVRGSAARWVHCNAYDLAPARIGGPVDFAVVGTILQHVRNPVGVLERVHDTLVPGGEAVLVETFSAPLTLTHPRRPAASFRPVKPGNRFSWWVPNLPCLGAWAVTAGLQPAGGRPQVLVRTGMPSRWRGDWVAAVRVRRPARTASS